MDDLSMDRDLGGRSTPNSFKLDEGFAEDSQQNSDHVQNSFVSWLNTQSDRAKADIAYEILRTLRSTDIAGVVERLNPLLHMDPIEKLPAEIAQQIFSYLDASTLLTASLSSSTWRDRILDPRIWQNLYESEGWGIDLDEIRRFEESHASLVRNEFRKAKEEIRGSPIHKGQPHYKRRATSDWLQSTPRRVSADVTTWREQHGTVEADLDPTADREDETMTDAPLQSPQRPNKRASQDSDDDQNMEEPGTPRQPASWSNLMLFDDYGDARMDWAEVYRRRQKLEQNWLNGRFANFQLPHPKYPQEAHTECVYTIQFDGKWLVSGSRDKTLRVWDLDTRRLRGKPLKGHSQSVLCLQFDPSPEEDIIVSGSSDSSIIIWKFSTGQQLQTIYSAHEESVLNLRFDHRYLVTCSKDKKIKVWNRNPLPPNHPDYPTAKAGPNCTVPAHILDLSKLDINMIEVGMADDIYKTLRPYTQLMTLEGHGAAVNAIQIQGNTIVSASGDRLIRVWDLATGACTKSVPGHMKGIACVQYDGKRIVSGSSDNTVRIYDAATSVEVATLLGHTNLVRTVQAGFGDSPGSETDMLAAAKAAEKRYKQELEAGNVSEDRDYSRRVRRGDFGSSRQAVGSKLPPGGGGSKWARIVSGSYDESIIIWKKDNLGHWVVGQVLKQDEKVRENLGQPSSTSTSRDSHLNTEARRRRPQQNPGPGQNVATPATPVANPAVMSATQIMQAAMNTSIASMQTGVRNIAGINTMLGARAVQNAVNQIASQVQTTASTTITNTATNSQAGSTANVTAGGSSSSGRSNAAPSTPAPTRTPSIPPQPPVQPQRPPPQERQRHPHDHRNGQNVSRVFKLQFDARRIVCCSQDSRIVGWDFANGDPEIEDCTRFFVGP